MENFAIAFSVPAAFVLSTIYCALLTKVVRRFDRLRRFLYSSSLIGLGLFLVELALVASLGAVRSRAIIGPSFYVAHVAFFFLGTPALANALVLRGRGPFMGRQYVTVVVCTVFALFLVLTQYYVSEALYGVDGTNGPFI